MAIGANNLLMLALSNYRRKLFDLQTFQNQAHIISVTGIIIYFLGTYYLYTPTHRACNLRQTCFHDKTAYVGFLTIVEGPSQPVTTMSVTILSFGT